jgi:microcystin-dependent protein
MSNFTYVANCVNNLSPGVPAGTVVAYSGFTLPTGWLWANGAAVARATYPGLLAALSASATVTITIASPALITWTANGLSNGWPVQFATTGALPTGLVAGATYYVVSAATNTFQVAAAPGGTPINTSGSQSGTQTGILAPYGNGDGSTTFTLPDLRGRVAFGLDNLGGATAANRITGASGVQGTTPAAGGGEEMHTLTINEMPSHVHGVNDPTHTHGASGAGLVGNNLSNGTSRAVGTGDGVNSGYFQSVSVTVNAAATGISIQANGGSGAHNNMPPTLMTNYIIKY